MVIPESLHAEGTWRAQYSRLCRWHQRVRALVRTEGKRTAPQDELDFIFAYFQTCFHLKEWLWKSGAVSQAETDSLTNQHFEFKLCRDICNGTKHFKISEAKASVDFHFSIQRDIDPFEHPTAPGYRESYTIIFDHEGSRLAYDLFGLELRCFEIWNAFLESKGFISPGTLAYMPR